jgi:hypothetical protein
VPADDRQRMGMDGERLQAVSRLYPWTLQRIFGALVWGSQSASRRLLGD